MEADRARAIATWRSTGHEALPALAGNATLPVGDNGDKDRRELFFRSIVSMYSCVGSSQGAPRVTDRETHAVHQLLVSNGAIAASEGEAFLRLISVGLEQPATVHLRSLGESVRRMVVCHEYPALAAQLYDCAEPSWRKLASKLPISNAPTFDKSEHDMRSLEMTKPFRKARSDVIDRFHVLSDLEFAIWSKRSHGDIFALVQVSQALSSRSGDVRDPINRYQSGDIETNGNLMRAIGFVLMGISILRDTFGLESNGAIEAIADDYGAMQQRDLESGALRIRLPE